MERHRHTQLPGGCDASAASLVATSSAALIATSRLDLGRGSIQVPATAATGGAAAAAATHDAAATAVAALRSCGRGGHVLGNVVGRGELAKPIADYSASDIAAGSAADHALAPDAQSCKAAWRRGCRGGRKGARRATGAGKR